jgi:hypothetical protein
MILEVNNATYKSRLEQHTASLHIYILKIC